MAGQGNGRPKTYKVSHSASTRKLIKELHRQSALAGQGQRFTEALATIYRKLQTEPSEFGEPFKELKKAKLQLRRAFVPPIVVEYGVHKYRPLVFVRLYKLLS
jgi:hypothetical protein